MNLFDDEIVNALRNDKIIRRKIWAKLGWGGVCCDGFSPFRTIPDNAKVGKRLYDEDRYMWGISLEDLLADDWEVTEDEVEFGPCYTEVKRRSNDRDMDAKI